VRPSQEVVERFDLAVIGSGSGNVVIPKHLGGRKAALIESAVFGGTCVNRGCIPSKMLVGTADVALSVRRASAFGIQAEVEAVDWPAIRNRVLKRIGETSSKGRRGRLESTDVTLFEGHARFASPHELVIDDHIRVEAEQIVIATGGRPSVPDVVEKSGIAFHTSDTIMWMDRLPASMVILGGGSVAAEFGHVFSSLGVDITLVTIAPTLLETHDAEIARRFTAKASTRWKLNLNASVSAIESDDQGVVLILEDGRRIGGETLLVATGRRPNTEDLGLQSAGISLRDDGHIVVDEFGRAAPGVWALGDVSSPYELKHVANAEARTVSHNVTNADDLRPLPHEWVPSAVFSDPQIASVGARAEDLDGRQYVEAIQEYSDTAFGWALQDEGGMCKLYADPATGTLLGAHILGHEASLLITPLIQAVAHRQRVADLARGQFWIHPALSEVVENALLKLPLDREVRSGQTH
jgi:mycothione reductase